LLADSISLERKHQWLKQGVG